MAQPALEFAEACSPADIDHLRRAALFRDHHDGDLRDVLGFSRKRRFPAKSVIVVQDRECLALFILILGTVKILRAFPHSQEKIVGFALAGDPIGESGLFSPRGYPETAVAMDTCEAIEIPAGPFVRCMACKPELSRNLLIALSCRLRHLVEQIELMAAYSAEQKVAAFLLHAHDGENGHLAGLDFPVRRRDIASLLSITPETLCRVIAEFRRRAWIAADRGRIAIESPEGLASVLRAAHSGDRPAPAARAGARFTAGPGRV